MTFAGGVAPFSRSNTLTIPRPAGMYSYVLVTGAISVGNSPGNTPAELGAREPRFVKRHAHARN